MSTSSYAPFIDSVPTVDLTPFLTKTGDVDSRVTIEQKRAVAAAIADASTEYGSFWVIVPSYDVSAWKRVNDSVGDLFQKVSSICM
jgi:hypothetical protein